MTVKKYNHKQINKIVQYILKSNGLSEEDVRTVSNSLIAADLRGVNSHGILRLPIYVKRIKNGKIKFNPEIRHIKETNATLVLDGDHGLGQVVSQKAVNELIEKASNSNIAAVTVRNSNHYGAAAYWSSQLANENMIGLSVSNVEPLMPPPGGAAARVGNNPISFTIPAGEKPPIVLDMATSVVPLGKILNAQSKNESIPEGWAVNSNGNPTTDPNEVVNGGSLFPVGGPKGYGLSIVIDVLSALLSNGAVGEEIHSMYQEIDKHNNISHFFLGIKIEAFMEIAKFKTLVDQYIDYIKLTPLAQNTKEIYLPGEIEHLNYLSNQERGITVPDNLIAELIDLAKEFGLEQSLIEEYTKPQDELVK
ncbi:Ldh family oxidoreductase [Oceanobacillus piezotolerans]|uniref:Ldh family oxidoreductase n=1 Tax=Oceanobacillus piezotolerans TaxID=2448030 RepID=A0A498D2N0_9BACI|nr:Ldh family oxidoreductase [Oceanobacillus piezotolerans]RLL41138.1 Ldh family oxidoreductase [Oceanobacillus piezotolerans]